MTSIHGIQTTFSYGYIINSIQNSYLHAGASTACRYRIYFLHCRNDLLLVKTDEDVS